MEEAVAQADDEGRRPAGQGRICAQYADGKPQSRQPLVPGQQIRQQACKTLGQKGCGIIDDYAEGEVPSRGRYWPENGCGTDSVRQQVRDGIERQAHGRHPQFSDVRGAALFPASLTQQLTFVDGVFCREAGGKVAAPLA